ncbi:hypothetical protein [Deinococcus humi]|uniref:Uncharacterized protein n=1 Tax=Deinococcus humi TaxID=662880 RepID=A0A7W8K1D0_9DEIO|nr:hypothetical protein [Deinococcus humi]MBB5365681.1 hypothetical protein [Deinococcus humi]GGO37096.1 hypothetical protein GCM10008949_41870 [Deinococcus humi]
MTNDAYSRRSPEIQHAAANIKMVRVLYAQRLRDVRHAARTGKPAAALILAHLRATPCAVPNPDRRSDCARHAAHAEALHRDLSTLDLHDVTVRAKLTAAAKQADLFAILQQTAPF